MDRNQSYEIRNMTVDEVAEVAVEWAAGEGWNPGFGDAECFFNTDSNGFLAGFLNEKPVACISAVAYDRVFAFIGFYIVKPEFRGRGYGLKIWEEALKRLPTQNIGLDGVVEQQANYQKSGFKLSYNNIRFEGRTAQSLDPVPGILEGRNIMFDSLVRYDSQLFPVSRPGFLRSWLNQPESRSLVAVEGEKIAGYAVIRRCRNGYKIGPLFADDEEIAEKLFLAVNNLAEPGSPVYLDTPEINRAATELAGRHGMLKVFETARMYSKSLPDIDVNRVFGVTTFELG